MSTALKLQISYLSNSNKNEVQREAKNAHLESEGATAVNVRSG